MGDIAKNSFEYDLEIPVYQILKDPEIVVKKIEQANIICKTCGFPFTFKFTKKWISFRCKCGQRTFYPKRKDLGDVYFTTWIPKDKFVKDYKHLMENGKK